MPIFSDPDRTIDKVSRHGVLAEQLGIAGPAPQQCSGERTVQNEDFDRTALIAPHQPLLIDRSDRC